MRPELTPRAGPPRLLLVVAHPDDETFGCGSLLLHAAARGMRTVVVCATRGEAGEATAGPTTSEDLGVVRERELRAAAAVLQVSRVDLLDFRDSGMSGAAGSQTLAGAPFAAVRDQVRACIEQTRPQVVVTLDGGDGHRDHVRIRDATLAAVDDASWPVQRLYLQCLPKSLMARWVEHMTTTDPSWAHLRSDLPGTPDESVTTVIDTAAFLPTRARAIAMHRSQKSPHDGLPDDLRADFLTVEHLRRLRPPWTGGPIEHDMLAGVSQAPARYFDTSDWDPRDALSGGARRIPITTPSGEFWVWTKRVGTNPDLKVLLLHGGPGATSEGYECFDTWLPGAGIEYYHYDQLGSFRSAQPDDPSLWDLRRFVDEVEQVRVQLGLDASNFVLLGQSWGGLLAMEYALHHQGHLKGLVISNMMSSAPLYNAYAHEVLMPAMDQDVLAQIKDLEARGATDDPRYEQLLMEHHYVLHVCRMPLAEWPDPVLRLIAHINPAIYVPMQGPSELGLSGSLEDWDRSGDLAQITVPTLVVGATHDTMDPSHMRWMAEQLPLGRYLHCPNGSHLAQYDDPAHYFPGLIDFLQSL